MVEPPAASRAGSAGSIPLKIPSTTLCQAVGVPPTRGRSPAGRICGMLCCPGAFAGSDDQFRVGLNCAIAQTRRLPADQRVHRDFLATFRAGTAFQPSVLQDVLDQMRESVGLDS